MRTSDFDYELPPELIAQVPLEPRDRSRLMVINRRRGDWEHRSFREIMSFLRKGDVLVFNDSRVLPARLAGRKEGSGGRAELLLLRRLEPNVWEAMTRPARRLRVGSRLEILPCGNKGANSGIGNGAAAEVIDIGEGGIRVVRFTDETCLSSLGEVPLPPYIRTPLADPERYQTVYARQSGSAAAPTAGLHFTPGLLREIEASGVSCHFVTLHVGLDTFLPVREDDPTLHIIHREYGVVGTETAVALTAARRDGRRIVAVGTTTVRLLEALAPANGTDELAPFADWVDIFILPGYRFQLTDAMITNFHLPQSTLLMMVSAFAGKGLIDRAYREAIARKYRFYSFGDAMLIHDGEA